MKLPIQELETVVLITAIKECIEKNNLKATVCYVHDSIISIVPKDEIELYNKRVADLLEDLLKEKANLEEIIHHYNAIPVLIDEIHRQCPHFNFSKWDSIRLENKINKI